MIYLRCPFCDKVSGEIEGNAILKEPIANYYSYIQQGGNLTCESMNNINGLMYFPHYECFKKRNDIEQMKRDAGTFTCSSKTIRLTGDI
jgi:hypothetical protein